MEIKIKIFEENNQISKEKYFGADIHLNKKWFKEITGLSTKEDLLNAILINEDLLTEINNTENDSKTIKRKAKRST